MRNFIQYGEGIELPAPADVVSGQLFNIGALVGVAAKSVAAGELVSILYEGVFDLPKAAQDVAIGDVLYFDAAANNLTKTASGNKKIAIAVAPAASADALVRAHLPGFIP